MVYRFIARVLFIFLISMILIQSQGLIQITLLLLPPTTLLRALKLDILSISITSTVVCITICVIHYCTYYIASDSYNWRFLVTIFLFALSMCALITRGSTAILLLGWDGLGLSSYFLVAYYPHSRRKFRSLITVLTNRVGDVFLVVLVLILLISSVSILRFNIIRTNHYFTLVLTWLVLLGAITKRAIFPWVRWLPEAMAAPTPVSSLVHSSTLVTAGVFLLFRLKGSLIYISLPLIIVGSFTLLLRGFRAMYCLDAKKLVALSTLSQVRFIALILARNLLLLTLCHMISHAIFKSTLFMSIGRSIHNSLNRQDSRLISSKYNTFEVGVPLIRMWGLPFLAGFRTKEALLLRCSLSGSFIISCFIGVFRVIITLSYRMRILIGLVRTSVTNSFTQGVSKDLFRVLALGRGLSIITTLTSLFISITWFRIAGALLGLASSWYISPNTAQGVEFNSLNSLLFKESSCAGTEIMLRRHDWDSNWAKVIGPKGVALTMSKSVNFVYRTLTSWPTLIWGLLFLRLLHLLLY